jgi:hypothetical protein
MFTPKSGFEQVPDDAICWRYQDLPRFLDLLIRKQLFFTRIDQFEDPFEGKFSMQQNEAGDSPEGTAVTVNTWHQNDEENYAMWNIYARNYGVAIQTNYRKLKECFHKTDKPVHIGKVIYFNERDEQLPVNDPLASVIRKRCIYQYENEIRCCYLMTEDEKDVTWEDQGDYHGVFIEVDLHLLIEKIYVSPYAPRWFRNLVEKTSNAFGLQKEIVHSKVFMSEHFL